MANKASDIRMGGAYVELDGRDAKLDATLKRAKDKVQKWGAEIRSIGLKMAAGAGAISLAFADTVRFLSTYGDTVAKMSARTGVSVEMLYKLGHAAELAGSSLGNVERGIRGMNRMILDVVRQNPELLSIFKTLEIDTNAFLKMSQDERITTLFNSLSRISDAGLRASLAMKLLSRGGSELLPLMQAGADAFERASREAELLGLVLSGDVTRGAEEINDWFTRAKRSLDGLRLAIGAMLYPYAVDLMHYITAWVVALRKWIETNPQVVNSAIQLTQTIFGLSAAFVALGTAMIMSSLGMWPWVAVIGILLAVADTLGLVETGFSELGRHIKIGEQSLTGWVEALWESLANGWFLIFENIKQMYNDLVASAKTFLIGIKYIGEEIRHQLARFQFGYGKQEAREEYARHKENNERLRKEGLAIWTERSNDVDRINAEYQKRITATGEKMALDRSNKGFLEELGPEFASIFEELKSLTASYSAPEPDLSGAGLGTSTVGSAGFFGGFRPSEFLGGPQTIEREQLTTLKNIDRSLERIVDNTKEPSGALA